MIGSGKARAYCAYGPLGPIAKSGTLRAGSIVPSLWSSAQIFGRTCRARERVLAPHQMHLGCVAAKPETARTRPSKARGGPRHRAGRHVPKATKRLQQHSLALIAATGSLTANEGLREASRGLCRKADLHALSHRLEETVPARRRGSNIGRWIEGHRKTDVRVFNACGRNSPMTVIRAG